MRSDVSEPAVDDVPFWAPFPAHDAQDFERQLDLFLHMFDVGFEGEFAVEEHAKVLVAVNQRDSFKVLSLVGIPLVGFALVGIGVSLVGSGVTLVPLVGSGVSLVGSGVSSPI